LAAARIAPIAPSRLATIWVRDAGQFAECLGLRPTETGANVVLVEVDDENFFDAVTVCEGVHYVAPALVVADLLTSPGRGPQEGEAMLSWMHANEEKWRR